MKPIFQKIWDLALPYQDKRGDAGHAEIVLKYAMELVKLEKADEDVVIPAAILHDIGYSQMPVEEWSTMFVGLKTEKEIFAVRIKHQKESVKLAKQILEKIGYKKEIIPEILEIVFQHDTRQGFLSKNDGVMRDADKLWRFSKVGFWLDVKRHKTTPQKLCAFQEPAIEAQNFFYSESAKRIAKEEIEKRKAEFGGWNG